MIESKLFTVTLTHPILVIIEITSAGVKKSSNIEGGQVLRRSQRVVADRGVESLDFWIPKASRFDEASRYNEGVVDLHSTCTPTVR